jgi:anaerobic selenocysteine-containing dehydrogenase
MIDYTPLKRAAGTRKEYDHEVRSFCRECPVGCGLWAYVKDGRIVDLHGDEQHPVSRGRLCARGVAFMQGLDHPARLVQPSVRENRRGPPRLLDDWEKGMDVLAERLRRSRERFGPEGLLIGCDPEAGVDFYAGALRYAALWGTPHVYHPHREPKAADSGRAPAATPPGGSGPAASTGKPVHPPAALARTPAVPCTEWSRSRCLFLVEADLAATHPVAFGRVLEAQRAGTRVVAVNSRFSTTLAKADSARVIPPHSGNALGIYLVRALLEEGLIDPAAVGAAFPDADADAWRSSYQALSFEGAEAVTGLTPARIRELARMLAHEGPVTVITGKSLAFLPYRDVWPTLTAAAGWQNNPGGAWYPLEAGMPDFDGYFAPTGADMEAVPPADRSFPYDPPIHALSEDGDPPAKALILSGNALNDFLRCFRQRAEQADLAGYFGMFPNETYELSHLALPAAFWPETGGIAFSNDRAVQWSDPVVPARLGCRSGLDFWLGLARRFGWEEHFPWQDAEGRGDVRSFYDELLHAVPETSGLTVTELERASAENRLVFWTGAASAEPGMEVEEVSSEAGSESTSFDLEPLSAPSESELAPPEPPDDLHPLRYLTAPAAAGSSNAGRWYPWTSELSDEDAIQIHPDTAAALAIESGDSVVVTGPSGVVEGRARLSRAVPRPLVSSPRPFGDDRVLIHKQGQSPQQALQTLREFLHAIGTDHGPDPQACSAG